jgi:acyl-CoA reductase-like NAD-dependent aldehyde dehydrogenase
MSTGNVEVMQQLREQLGCARKAQELLSHYSSAQMNTIVAAMARRCEQAAERLARRELGATGMGRVASKIARLEFIASHCCATTHLGKTAGLLGQSNRRGVYEIAEPLGLILSFLPTTNPLASVLFQSLMAIAARNCVVFVPPQHVRYAVAEAVETLHEASLSAGAPATCLSSFSSCGEELWHEVMQSREVDFLLAAGPSSLVHAVHSAGKPAIATGYGNTPAYIDRSAHIGHAVRCLLQSKQMDWGVSEAAEESVVVDNTVAKPFLEEMRRHGVYILNEGEVTQMAACCEQNRQKIMGQPPFYVASLAGVQVPVETSLLLAPLAPGTTSPLATPKFSSLLSCYVVNEWESAALLCRELISRGHPGCVGVVHAMNREVILEFAAMREISRLLVNAPACQGAIGMATALTPSLLLAGGTVSGTLASDNLSAKNFMQLRRVAAIDEEFSLAQDARTTEPALTQLRLTEPASGQQKNTANAAQETRPEAWRQAKAPRPPAFYLKLERRSWPWQP